MSTETEKKGKSWFKNVLTNQSHIEKDPSTDNVAVASTEVEDEVEQNLTDNNKQFFSKENQDKIALDVIVSLEAMLKDRQLLAYKKKGLDEKLVLANETINRLKQEIDKQEQIIQSKNNDIRDLENVLTNKQMSYDQLLEDYKAFQLTSS